MTCGNVLCLALQKVTRGDERNMVEGVFDFDLGIDLVSSQLNVFTTLRSHVIATNTQLPCMRHHDLFATLIAQNTTGCSFDETHFKFGMSKFKETMSPIQAILNNLSDDQLKAVVRDLQHQDETGI